MMIPYRMGDPKNIVEIQQEQIQIPNWFRNLHFLIVDDEEYNLYLIKNILNKWDTAFTEAFNGQEAVDLAQKTSFDLILMDIRMPVMDGYEAAQQILLHNSSARIIALTATTKPEDILKIEQAGMHAFLQKPFAEADLISLIRKLVTEKMSEGKPAEIAPIDMNELDRISGGDKAFLDEMLRIFIRSSEEALVKFRLNMQKSDFIAISEAAHKLAAPAKHMLAIELYNHLKKLENSAESLRPDEINGLIEIIENEIRQVNSFLWQKLGEE
jgi:CheY-like chemotaxis protein/HPt (histidine-containing phosphotransfer) domain-containing protein